MRTTLRSAMSALLFVASTARAAEPMFAVQEIASTGRTVAAELADFDGDGRQDVLQIVIYALPPDERRALRLYLQRGDGSIPSVPDQEWPLPDFAAAYDVGDVDGTPGAELILLRPKGLRLVSIERGETGALGTRQRDLPVPGERTLGVAIDERGIDRLAIAHTGFGSEPWLVVPGLGETFFLAPDGSVRARIDSGARANYFMQPPGPLLGESDIQIFLDAPRISVGDVDGDGRTDVVASGRHELRIFRGREGGTFPRAPDARIPLRRVSLEDHIRGSGSVRSVARDINGDGLLDLLLSLTVGSVMSASSNSYVFLNRGSGWDLDRPDAAYESDKTLSADQLIDLDGDGRLELVRMGIPIGVFEIVEIFVQSALDARLAVYDIGDPSPVSVGPPPPIPPSFTLDVGLPLDLETSRLAGFLPSIEFDVNGDGFMDFLSGTDGTRFEVLLGRAGSGFERAGRQDFVTEGQIRGGDLDADGLPDFVLFNGRRADAPIRLIVNRGRLPGTPSAPRLEPKPDPVAPEGESGDRAGEPQPESRSRSGNPVAANTASPTEASRTRNATGGAA